MYIKKKIQPKKLTCIDIIGEHPSEESPFGQALAAVDTHTDSDVPHRILNEVEGQSDTFRDHIREKLINHHVSPEAIQRDRLLREAMKRLGFEADQAGMKRFPNNPKTQKGNLAEVVLAEYLVEAANIDLPVYRLRYNPNVDQAMKGDDVLGFDIDSNPVRIMVGEAKFRSVSAKAAVTDMIESLVKSHTLRIPASLQFVADRLSEQGEIELAEKISNCAILFALEKLQLDYVGLLMSDKRSAERVKENAQNTLRRLVVISIQMDSPNEFNTNCYKDLGD